MTETLLTEDQIRIVEELLSKTTPGPWTAGQHNASSVEDLAVDVTTFIKNREGTTCYMVTAEPRLAVCLTANGPTSEANARFIAGARRFVQDLLLERALLLQEIARLKSGSGTDETD